MRILVFGADLHRLVDLLLRLRHSGLRLGELLGPGRQLGEGLFQFLDLLPEFPDSLRAGRCIHLDHSFDIFCHYFLVSYEKCLSLPLLGVSSKRIALFHFGGIRPLFWHNELLGEFAVPYVSP